MKQKQFARMLMLFGILLLLMPIRALAVKIPVAILRTNADGKTKTLTFTYAERPKVFARRGQNGIHRLNVHNNEPKENELGLYADQLPTWVSETNADSTITTAIFDKSFENARPSTTAFWFAGFDHLANVEGVEYLNTINVKSMTGMFLGCSNLENIDLSHFVTDNVEEAGFMFLSCKSLKEVDFSNFNFKKIATLNICKGCTSLHKLLIGNNDFVELNSQQELADGLFSGVGTEENPCLLILGDSFNKFVIGNSYKNDSGIYYFNWLGGYFTLSLENATNNIPQKAQATPTSTYNNDNKIYAENDVDEKASFPGGWKAYGAYIDENIIHSNNVKRGNIGINAVVEKDGSITNAQIEYSPDNSINNVALNLLKQMPKWTPAKRNGQAVRSQVSLFYNIKRN